MDSGYRLISLDVFNWGTFDKHIWRMELDGHGCLLTGENGTGKSTLIDAFLSLLVPSKQRSYNMSSGSQRRERNETSYVRGAYQREKNRWDQIQVKYLRKEDSLSALSAHFLNPITKDSIVLAQFFWFDSGDLRKCLVISHHAFSLQQLLDSIKTPADLRYQLKQLPHTTIFPTFNEYQDYFIRYVGLRSSKAMNLFNQVSTIKQIGDLNEFIRDNMLEHVDMQPTLDEFFHTFEDLTLAHQAIHNARLQIESLDGIDKDARKFSDTDAKMIETNQLQTYLPRYFSAQQHLFLSKTQNELVQALRLHESALNELDQDIHALQQQLALSTQSTDSHHQLLPLLERELHEASLMYQRCQKERAQLEHVRKTLGFETKLTLEQFTKDQLELPTLKIGLEQEQQQLTHDAFKLKQTQQTLKEHLDLKTKELINAQHYKTLLPTPYLELRRRLCETLHLSTQDLPYAAELMTLSPEHMEWRLAAEKLLRPLALKLLVPESYFKAANQFLRHHNIGMKIVLQSIPLEWSPNPFKKTPRAADTLLDKLIFYPTAKQTPWLKQHIQEHFDYQCVTDLDVFQTASRAITLEGLIKRQMHISEKDDRPLSQGQYILGWSYEDRIHSLSIECKALQSQLNTLEQQLISIDTALLASNQKLSLLAQYALFDLFDTVNTDLWTDKIKAIETQKQALLKHPETKALNALKQRLTLLTEDRDQALAEGAVIRNQLNQLPPQIERLETILNTLPLNQTLDEKITLLIKKHQEKHPDSSISSVELQLSESLRRSLASLAETKQQLSVSLVRKMSSFKTKFPEITIDLDASLDDLPQFLQKYQQLKKEDLPTHETRFKQLISKSVITDLTAFKSTLELSAEDIKEHINHLNEALNNIAYTDHSYIQIRMTKTKDPEIREFQAMLRNAVQMKKAEEDTIDLEESFQRIRTIIDQLKHEDKWSRRVTDVRNWTDFFMVELAKTTHDEISFYSDSAGLSGGQKAKLAFTILASALAYQYGLHHGSALEKSFRFVMIDEAFSKSDDSNSQYALKLFKTLGLQLLVVTPMDKLNIIKPFIERIILTQIPKGEHRSELASIKTTSPSLLNALNES